MAAPVSSVRTFLGCHVVKKLGYGCVSVLDPYHGGAYRLLWNERVVYYDDVSFALIYIMFVLRVGEKAYASRLPVLYPRESGHRCLRIAFHCPFQYLRNLFCLEFHRIIED